MDNKALKTGVYFNENIFNEICEQPIDVDFTLPDFCPDISKIFKCKANARIISKSVSGKNVTVEGNVCITLLYCDSDKKLCSYEYLYPFSKIKEMPVEAEDCSITCCVKCDYINCRAVTGRKVDIHGAVSLNIRVFARKSNEIICDYDGDNVQLKRAIAPATVPMGYREKPIIVEDEINIGGAQAPILSVLRYDAVPCVSECKVINDKIVVKGEMAVNILYNADTVKLPQVVKTTIPFSQIVEMSGVTDECKCDVKSEICSLEIKPIASLGGECRTFMINAKVMLKCESFCVNDIPVIEDAFSTKFETTVTRNKLTFERICENIKENCHVKKNIELSENLSSVIDIWCELGSQKVRFEKGNMCLSAVFLVGLVVCDQEDNVSFCEKPIDFEWNYPLDCDSSQLHFDPEIEICALNYTILSANCLELRIELSINGAIYEKSNIELLTDMLVDTKMPSKSSKKGGMVICFTNNGSCVWDVARKYNASIDEIMAINGLNEDDIRDKKMILVPIN